MRCGWIPGDLNLIAKKPMRDRVFLDTNILIYIYSEEKDKRERSLRIIEENEDKDIIISLQIVNEFVNILLLIRVVPYCLRKICSITNRSIINLKS